MDFVTISVIAILIANLILAVWFFLSYRARANDQMARLDSALQLFKAELIGKQAESMFSLKDAVDSTKQTISDRMAEGNNSLDRRMAILGDIENKLGRLSVQTTSMEEIGKNIQSLSELLRPPKLRGQLGELFLENILAQILPRKMFNIQHAFKDGQRVDAAVKIGDRLLPVDAKFPREAFERLSLDAESETAQKEFNKVLKKHIDDVANKYIRPAEGTTEFAIMYIPAESVYYQLISQKDDSAFSYALSRNIVPSSPGHLYAFLASLSAVYSEVQLAQAGLTQGSRRLSTAVQELMNTTENLEKFHGGMEGSFRRITALFEKARSEVSDIKLSLERLREPNQDSKIEESTE